MLIYEIILPRRDQRGIIHSRRDQSGHDNRGFNFGVETITRDQLPGVSLSSSQTLKFRVIKRWSYSALVALYLLATSWTTTVFSLSSCIRFKEGIKSLQMLSVIQSYLFFAFVSILLITTKTFGSSPECNVNAVLVIYAPFPVIEAGRIVGGIITLVVVLAYTYMVLKDYFAKIQERVKPEIGVLRDLTGESNLVVEIPDITEPNPQRPTNPQRSSSTPENINVVFFFIDFATNNLSLTS